MIDLLKGTLIRRLFFMFVTLGVIPMVLFAVLSLLFQLQISKQAIDQASTQSRDQAQLELGQFAAKSAARYDVLLQDEGIKATTLAKYFALILDEKIPFALTSPHVISKV